MHHTIHSQQSNSIPNTVIETNPASSLFAMYLEPFRNIPQQTYQTIITLDTYPNGPIQSRITRINPPSLSPFQTVSNTNSSDSCIYVLNRTDNQYMTKEDIPDIFSYLIKNGYTIDTSLTKMMNQSNIIYGGPSSKRISGNRSLICMIRYDEPTN